MTLGCVPFVEDTGLGSFYPPAASSLSSFEDLKDDEEEEGGMRRHGVKKTGLYDVFLMLV